MRPLRQAKEQWLFTEAELVHAPSRLDGIALESELVRRREVIRFMRSLWLRVQDIVERDEERRRRQGRAPEKKHVDPESPRAKSVLTAGAVFVHRFYMRRSLNDFEPPLIAAVMLFLASKVEEAPLRLRHIVNACLAKFEPGTPTWEPREDHDVPQPLEYRRWERDILATEEVALEALCFDTVVDQPWPALRAAVTGLDGLWAVPETESAAEAPPTNGTPHVMLHTSEQEFIESGWVLLNEGFLSPLGVLHRPETLACAVFVLLVAMTENLPLDAALAAASEIGDRFDLDLAFDPKIGAGGSDLAGVQAAAEQYLAYCELGLIDKSLPQLVNRESNPPPEEYTRRFKVNEVNGRAAAKA